MYCLNGTGLAEPPLHQETWSHLCWHQQAQKKIICYQDGKRIKQTYEGWICVLNTAVRTWRNDRRAHVRVSEDHLWWYFWLAFCFNVRASGYISFKPNPQMKKQGDSIVFIYTSRRGRTLLSVWGGPRRWSRGAGVCSQPPLKTELWKLGSLRTHLSGRI